MGWSQPAKPALWIIKQKTTSVTPGEGQSISQGFCYRHDDHSLNLMLSTTFHKFKHGLIPGWKDVYGNGCKWGRAMCTALGHQHGQHYSSDSAVHRPATPAGWHSAAISYSSALWGGQDLTAHDLYLLCASWPQRGSFTHCFSWRRKPDFIMLPAYVSWNSELVLKN